MNKYLDYEGLQLYDDKVKSYIYPEVDTIEDLEKIKVGTYKESTTVYCKEDKSFYKIVLDEDGKIKDNDGYYVFNKIKDALTNYSTPTLNCTLGADNKGNKNAILTYNYGIGMDVVAITGANYYEPTLFVDASIHKYKENVESIGVIYTAGPNSELIDVNSATVQAAPIGDPWDYTYLIPSISTVITVRAFLKTTDNEYYYSDQYEYDLLNSTTSVKVATDTVNTITRMELSGDFHYGNNFPKSIYTLKGISSYPRLEIEDPKIYSRLLKSEGLQLLLHYQTANGTVKSIGSNVIKPKEQTCLLQVEQLPPSASSEGKVFEYIGTETDELKFGHVYKCVSDVDFFYAELSPNSKADIPSKLYVKVPKVSSSQKIAVDKVYTYDSETGTFSEFIADSIDTSGVSVYHTTGVEVVTSYSAEVNVTISSAIYTYSVSMWEWALLTEAHWEEVYEQTGGDSTFPEEFTTNVTVGGVESGTKIEQGKSVAEVVKSMLLKYIKPTVSITLTPATTLYYYGQSVDSESIKATVTHNSGKITKVTFTRGTTELTSSEEAEGVGTVTFTDTTAITDTVTYTATGSGTDDITATKTITFCNPTFAGVVDSTVTAPTADDITGLAKKLAVNNKGYTYSGITTTYGKILYAYPKALGALTKITDGVNNYFDSYTRSEVNVTINGKTVAYYAYLLTDAAGVTDFKQVYA